jgi:hypothetical protein
MHPQLRELCIFFASATHPLALLKVGRRIGPSNTPLGLLNRQSTCTLANALRTTLKTVAALGMRRQHSASASSTMKY